MPAVAEHGMNTARSHAEGPGSYFGNKVIPPEYPVWPFATQVITHSRRPDTKVIKQAANQPLGEAQMVRY